ncbi:MAG: ATP-binding protein [bacterium]
MRLLLTIAAMGYLLSYAYLMHVGYQGFVTDPVCIVLLVVAIAVSFRHVQAAVLLGLAAVASDLFGSLLYSGNFASQPTLVVAPILILVGFLFMGRTIGTIIGAVVAAMMPIAVALSGWWGLSAGFEPATVHGLIVAESVVLATLVALHIHVMLVERRLADRFDQNERFRLLVENMPNGIILISPEGRIEEFNPTAERLLNISRANILGCEVGGTTSRFPREILLLAAQMTHGEINVNERVISVMPSTAAWQGAQDRLLLVLQDITDRRAVEEHAKALQKQINSTQKLEAVGRLAAGVAHDFNNILTVVSGYIGLQSPELAAPDDAIHELKEAVDMGTKLVRQLLVFSRDEPSIQRPIDLAKLVTKIRPILTRLMGVNIEVSVQCDPICPVVGDYGKMEQVLVNLAANARDAMPAGGRFSIDCVLDGSEVVLTISDTGSGIPPEIVDHIFEAFFTTKDTTHGTGLGLATVFSVISDARGTIDVETSSQGTSFIIRLPAVDTDVSFELERRAFETPVSLRQRRVLLVEDNKSARALLSRYLTKNGFDVDAVASGDAVLERKELLANPPDVVVTDLVMPGISGIELIHRLQDVWGEFPYLLISGYTADTLNDEPSHTIARLIEKPFAPSDLVERIVELLR